MGDVHVLGAATTRFERNGGSAIELARRAATGAVGDAGVAPRELRAVFVGCRGSSGSGADAVSLALGRAGLGRADGAPEEHASASGARALHLAWRAVESGAYDLALCVGAQSAPRRANADLHARAAFARRYMFTSGTTREHLARAAAKNRAHGLRNPVAAVEGGAAPDTVLASGVLAWPLTELMVAPCTAGAAAVVLASSAMCRRVARSAPRVRASVLVGSGHAGAAPDDSDEVRAAVLTYAAAGLGPDDLDCAEVNDETAAAEIAAYETLQFVPGGQGPELIDAGFTALGGVLPVNTSGGMLSLGELDGAAGVAQLCELVRQVSGEAGARQVRPARAGLAHCRARTEDGEPLAWLSVVTA